MLYRLSYASKNTASRHTGAKDNKLAQRNSACNSNTMNCLEGTHPETTAPLLLYQFPAGFILSGDAVLYTD